MRAAPGQAARPSAMADSGVSSAGPRRSLAAARAPGLCSASAGAMPVAADHAWASWRPPREPGQALNAAAIQRLQAFRPGETLSASQSQCVFQALGVKQAREWLLGPDPDAWPAEAIAPIGFPCVLKVLSPDVPHKTEVGGVRLNIADADCEKANSGWRRFIWLNFFAGFVVSIILIWASL